ncbi:MAG: divalent-cation tolerance protein CutA [Candidatus Omnitrophota bacterium]
MKSAAIVICVTTPTRALARRIVSSLIKKRLIACGNVLSGVSSFFIWKGKAAAARETLILMKTRKGHFRRVAAEVRRLHSYEVPEIVALPIVDGTEEYLRWIDSSVTGR